MVFADLGGAGDGQGGVVVVGGIGVAGDEFPHALAFEAGVEIHAVGLALLELDLDVAGDDFDLGDLGLVGVRVKAAAGAGNLQGGLDGVGTRRVGLPLFDLAAQAAEGGRLLRGLGRGDGEPRLLGGVGGGDLGDKVVASGLDLRHAPGAEAEGGGVGVNGVAEVGEPDDFRVIGGRDEVSHKVPDALCFAVRRFCHVTTPGGEANFPGAV